jgi:hypothetical protein
MKSGPSSTLKSGLVLRDHQQKLRKLPNHCFYIRPSFVRGIDDKSEKIKLSLLTLKDRQRNLRDFWSVLSHWNVAMQIITYKYALNTSYRYSDLFFVTEQIPNPNSRVSLSDRKDKFGYPIARINWQLSQYDFDCMFKWYNIIKNEAFRDSGCNFTHSIEDLQWKNIFSSAAHHVGTARMSDSYKSGVVDANLRVFGTQNLFVCDGSVFPTSGNVNSGLTIACLACKLADHLK